MSTSKNASEQGPGNLRAWENAPGGVMSAPVWLAVCGGNTCRSPLLMFLVRYRLKQLGRGDTVTVESAGVPFTSTGKPVMEGKEMLPFAIEGLRKAAAWLDDQNNTWATSHPSKRPPGVTRHELSASRLKPFALALPESSPWGRTSVTRSMNADYLTETLLRCSK